MTRFFCLSFIIIFISSCEYLELQQKKDISSEIVAIVNTEKLFKKDLKEILPSDITGDDSLVLVRGYINDWAIKQLLLKKAETNNSKQDVDEIANLVRDYKESLIINNYKERLIKQQLDTVINDVEIDAYYRENKENFRLNEELLKIKYLHFDNNIINKKEIITLFKSSNIDDLENLEKQQLSFKFHQFNDSVWTRLDKVMLKLPFSKDNLLKKIEFVEKQDSLGLYLAAINDVLVRNDIAPLSYIKPAIKQMILHKRKIQLIRDIEKILVQDATKNNNFKVY